MKRIYINTGICVVLFWLAMIALLVQKQTSATAPVQLDAQYMDAFVESTEEWAGIYFQDKKIGYTRTVLKRLEDGYQLTEDTMLDMSMLGVAQSTEARINTVTDREFNMKVFSFRITSGVISFIAYGNVDDENVMSFTVVSGGKKEDKKVQLSEAPVIAGGLKYCLLKSGLKPGARYERTIFDPMTMGSRTVIAEVMGRETVAVSGRPQECYKIRETYKGIVMYAWIDMRGNTVKEESPSGMVLLRETGQQARYGGWGERPDMLAATAIEIDAPFNKSRLRTLTLRLLHIDFDGFQLDGGRQTLQDNLVTIVADEIDRHSSYTVPYSGEELAAFLQPSVFVQSDQPEIVRLAEVIGAGNRSALKLVRDIAGWVYENIEKRPTMSLPSAAEVLKSMQGDCNEHAVLTAALFRAAGIPAKIVAGIVYMKGKFYYHAWNEVYLNKWISVDATLGQFPADVTHVRFIEGDMDQQLLVLKLIGKLKIEVVDYR